MWNCRVLVKGALVCADTVTMDTDLHIHYSPERIAARRATEQRLAHAGAVAAEMLDAARSDGHEPSSREIADAIVRWLKTGARR